MKNSSESWDLTTTKSFLESEAAQFWPEYWETKVKIVNGLKSESRRGLLDFGLSRDFLWAVPYADEWTVRTYPRLPEKFPQLPEGGSPSDFFGGLLKGVLLYDELLWDASFFEREIMCTPSGLDPQHDEIAKSAAVSQIIDLMEKGLIVPHSGHIGISEKRELAIDRYAAYLSQDEVIQRIVREWHYEDIDDAGYVLPAFIKSLGFSHKYNASIISRGHEAELYDRILWHYSKQLSDKDVQDSLREVLSVSLPTYHLSSIDRLITLKKEKCVRHFREKVWSLFNSKIDNPDQSNLELLRELDEDRKELSEIIQALSHMKLAWAVATILVSPIFSVLPFPLNLSAPAISMATRETTAKIIERRYKKKYMWVFTVDNLRKLFVPWERNR